MIFFDLDDTLMDFKSAEHQGIKAFYNQFYEQLSHTEENEFIKEWERVGKNILNDICSVNLALNNRRLNELQTCFQRQGQRSIRIKQ